MHSLRALILDANSLDFAGFGSPNEHEAKRQSRTRENLWAHTLGPLNAPIQSEADFEVSSQNRTFITASDWIGAFKGPNQRFSRVGLCLALVREREKLWFPRVGFAIDSVTCTGGTTMGRS